MDELTPHRLPALGDPPALRCRKCGFMASRPHPVLRLACPTCFARWVADHVQQLEEVHVAAPIAEPADAALELRPDQRGIDTEILPRKV